MSMRFEVPLRRNESDNSSRNQHVKRLKHESLELLKDKSLVAKLGRTVTSRLFRHVTGTEAVGLTASKKQLDMPDLIPYDPNRPIMLVTGTNEDKLKEVSVPRMAFRKLGNLKGGFQTIREHITQPGTRQPLTAGAFVAKLFLKEPLTHRTGMMPVFSHVRLTKDPLQNTLNFMRATDEWGLHATGQTKDMNGQESVMKTTVKKSWLNVLGALVSTNVEIGEHIRPVPQLSEDEILDLKRDYYDPEDFQHTRESYDEQMIADAQMVAGMLSGPRYADADPAMAAELVRHMFSDENGENADEIAMGLALSYYYESYPEHEARAYAAAGLLND